MHILIPEICLFDNNGNLYKVVKFAQWYVKEDATLENSNVVDDRSAVDFQDMTELPPSGATQCCHFEC